MYMCMYILVSLHFSQVRSDKYVFRGASKADMENWVKALQTLRSAHEAGTLM